MAINEPELSDVSTAFTSIPATSESEKMCIGKLSKASGLRFISTSTTRTITESLKKKSKSKASFDELNIESFGEEHTFLSVTDSDESESSSESMVSELADDSHDSKSSPKKKTSKKRGSN